MQKPKSSLPTSCSWWGPTYAVSCSRLRARQAREPVRVERHEKVERDQGEDPRVRDQHCRCQTVLRPLRGLALDVDAAPPDDQAAGEPRGRVLTRLVEQPDVRTHRPVDVGQADTAEQQASENLPRDEERDVEPCLLGLDRRLHPRCPGGHTGQQHEQQHERYREERRGRFRGAFQRATPPRRGHLHHRREHDACLRQPAEEQEVHQQRLPRSDGVTQDHAVQKRRRAHEAGTEIEATRAVRDDRGADGDHLGFGVLKVRTKCTRAHRSSTLITAADAGMLGPPSRMML